MGINPTPPRAKGGRSALSREDELTVYRRRRMDEEKPEVLAVEFGVSVATVYNILKRLGLELVDRLERGQDQHKLESEFGLPHGTLGT